ncbi:DUF6207 family protein [Streptomyces sp. NPDC052042]|uniref:DUF6207 family protein n=1 Tax=Streptomyces sp. NPDC052042 TaxID=3365683 RepID=UPI0037D60102
MEPIHEQHLSEPGLVVLDITAADEATLHAVMNALDQLWATSGTRPARRVPGPGNAGRAAGETGARRRQATSDIRSWWPGFFHLFGDRSSPSASRAPGTSASWPRGASVAAPGGRGPLVERLALL